MSGVEKNTKVHVLLKHVGDAPPLQRKEVAIHREEKLLKVVAFIKKELNSKGGLFVYLKSSFSPNLNEQIGVLLDSFGTDVGDTRKLVLHYALSPAWG
ncbi:hypothetical protein M9434_002296 [Picochlorum sp. BPE23]|nr:hypothetical protein M9435_006556 [Picochlorum sp. BPE23]KAI8114170.1 hypothetical protein M9434_002296 [Picochlorum sp. BPE23]